MLYTLLGTGPMNDSSLLLKTEIDSEFLMVTSNLNQLLKVEVKKEFLKVFSTVECWYTVCPCPNGLTYSNQIF